MMVRISSIFRSKWSWLGKTRDESRGVIDSLGNPLHIHTTIIADELSQMADMPIAVCGDLAAQLALPVSHAIFISSKSALSLRTDPPVVNAAIQSPIDAWPIVRIMPTHLNHTTPPVSLTPSSRHYDRRGWVWFPAACLSVCQTCVKLLPRF